jgi:hypothetical protein
MNREDIIQLARQAGLWPTEEWSKEYGIPTPNEQWLPELERFAALVAAAECELIAQSLDKQADLAADEIDRQWAQEMAAAVRARG